MCGQAKRLAAYLREEPDALRSARPGPSGGYRVSDIPTGISKWVGIGCFHPSSQRCFTGTAPRPTLKGQHRGDCSSDRLRMRTLRYSLRRVSPLNSVNGGPHNPKVGGSNPPRNDAEQTECRARRQTETGSRNTKGFTLKQMIWTVCVFVCARCTPGLFSINRR